VIRKKVYPYFLIAPSLIVIFTVIVFPLARGISLAFTNRFLTSFDYDFIGIAQFKKLFQDPYFFLSFKNSLIWTVVGVLTQILIAFILAYLLNLGLKGERIFRGLFLIPWSMSTIITCVIWLWLFNPMYGHLNYYLSVIGIKSKIYFLANTKIALLSVMAPLIWRGYPFVMLVFLAGLQSIDKELYEAATIDGASAWQQLRYITLPLLSPLMKIIVILEIVWVFNAFDFVWIMTKGGPGGSTHLLSTYSYYNAFSKFDVGYGSAVGVVIFTVLIIVSVIYLRSLREGMR
jgi:multiple sugar transport system permease protein